MQSDGLDAVGNKRLSSGFMRSESADAVRNQRLSAGFVRSESADAVGNLRLIQSDGLDVFGNQRLLNGALMLSGGLDALKCDCGRDKGSCHDHARCMLGICILHEVGLTMYQQMMPYQAKSSRGCFIQLQVLNLRAIAQGMRWCSLVMCVTYAKQSGFSFEQIH